MPTRRRQSAHRQWQGDIGQAVGAIIDLKATSSISMPSPASTRSSAKAAPWRLPTLVTAMPEALNVAASVKVTLLTAPGGSLENVVARIEASREEIRIHEISASLPGRSRALFEEGIYFPGETGNSNWPGISTRIHRTAATGDLALARGRPGFRPVLDRQPWPFKMQTEVSLTEPRLRLSKAQYANSTAFPAASTCRSAPRPRLPSNSASTPRAWTSRIPFRAASRRCPMAAKAA